MGPSASIGFFLCDRRSTPLVAVLSRRIHGMIVLSSPKAAATREVIMTGVLYSFLGVASLGLLVICVYFLLRKDRELANTVALVN